MGLDILTPPLAAGGIVNGPLTVAGGLVIASHVTTSGTAPGVVVGAAAGAGATAAMVAGSTDEAGIISITTNGTPAAGVLATLTFAVAYAAAPKIVKDIVFAASAGYIAYFNAITPGGFVLEAGVAFTIGTFLFPYQVVG